MWCAGSSRARTIASVRSAVVGGSPGASSPVWPGCNHSVIPPTAYATAGRPTHPASIPTSPKGSGHRLGTASRSADRIEFIQGYSKGITLPERADVIISDLHGVLPLNDDTIVTLIDARERLLAPGGRFIQARETLWLAGVDAPEMYDVHASKWDATVYDLDLGPARDITLNRVTRGLARPDQVRLDPQHWATLDYATVQDPNVRGRFEWEASEAATIHGLCVWFDAELGDGIGFSNRPGEPETVFGNGFLPLRRPGLLEPGDQVVVELRAELVGGE